MCQKIRWVVVMNSVCVIRCLCACSGSGFKHLFSLYNIIFFGGRLSFWVARNFSERWLKHHEVTWCNEVVADCNQVPMHICWFCWYCEKFQSSLALASMKFFENYASWQVAIGNHLKPNGLLWVLLGWGTCIWILYQKRFFWSTSSYLSLFSEDNATRWWLFHEKNNTDKVWPVICSSCLF